MNIESLREELTEVRISAMGKSFLPLMSQMTSDRIQPDIRTENNRIEQAHVLLSKKFSKATDDSDIVLSGETYQISALSGKGLFDEYSQLRWSEEIFNSYLSLINQKSSSHYLFDTLTTTRMFSCLQDTEAQLALVKSKGTYQYYMFPVLTEGFLTLYLVIPNEKQLTIFSTQASCINQ